MKFQSLSVGVLMLALQAHSIAAPVINDSVFFVERREANTVPRFSTEAGERTLWNMTIGSSGPCSGISAVVSRGLVSFNLNLDVDPILFSCNFSQVSLPFSSTNDLLAFAGQTDPWSYTVSDSTGSVTGLFRLIANPQALPYVEDIMVSDASATPTVSWSIPSLFGFDVDRIRLRVINADSGLQLFQANLAPNTTSFTLAPGILQTGSSYYYRISLDDLENGSLENRSNAFSTAAMRVPEPGTLLLVAVAMMGLLGVSQRRKLGAVFPR